MSGSVATGDRLSPIKYLHGAWLWPEVDTVQAGIVFARLPDLHAALTHVTGRGVCVQAGGNMGVWPKALAYEFAAVYTFEPDPLNFRCLCANVPEENVFKFNAAVGTGHEGCRGMARTSNCGAHYLDGPGGIPVLTIDALGLPQCDFIQLDVEGYEPEALVGGRDTIQAYHPVIMIEDKAFKRRAIERGEGIEKAESDCSRLLRSWGYDIAAAFTENGSCDFLYVWRDF